MLVVLTIFLSGLLVLRIATTLCCVGCPKILQFWPNISYWPNPHLLELNVRQAQIHLLPVRRPHLYHIRQYSHLQLQHFWPICPNLVIFFANIIWWWGLGWRRRSMVTPLTLTLITPVIRILLRILTPSCVLRPILIVLPILTVVVLGSRGRAWIGSGGCLGRGCSGGLVAASHHGGYGRGR